MDKPSNPSSVAKSDRISGAGRRENGFLDDSGTFVKRNRAEGHVIQCDGNKAIILAEGGSDAAGSDDYWAVGQMISIRVNDNRIVGFVYQVDTVGEIWDADAINQLRVVVEIVGEVRSTENGNAVFSRGVTTYPYMGAIAHRIRAVDLEAMYATESGGVTIGTLSQDERVSATIDVDKLLSRHFAVVGSTGVGKSTAIALLLRKIVETKPRLRALVLDPHNEFSAAFGEKALTIDANQLDLPYWMFRFEEFIEVIYRGRPAPVDERDALQDLIPLAKHRYETGGRPETSVLVRDQQEISNYTADTPVPYRMQDLLTLIDERLGQLEGKEDRPHLRAIRNRLKTLLFDSRFQFMFGRNAVADCMQATLSKVFRLPIDGKPICVFEMSNLPGEVVNAVVSVLCRIAFELATSSDGTIETLVLCEEAHRYIPADKSAGFLPTRLAISRIAKEGRKYGVHLGIVTQRPGELDQTILSQCSTIFAMRLANEYDQEIIRRASVGAAKSTLSFLSSIANRECIAFGEAFQTPMRMQFETLPPEQLPGAHIYEQRNAMADGGKTPNLGKVIARLRKENGTGDEEDDFSWSGSAQPKDKTSAPDIDKQDMLSRVRARVLGAEDDANNSEIEDEPLETSKTAPTAPVRQTGASPAKISAGRLGSGPQRTSKFDLSDRSGAMRSTNNDLMKQFRSKR
ncbi:ATP-binding protein [Notoacmeibacter sp. MSK16QG-6]|uniref:ATP-binding protein n=1 Tax=Notoacmeibacter sp. MSK16QG-6 TaxID=2957982 RepID=UPI00209D2FD9|nr:DUF87 domain-containing protein [Notoacmeibacter sp. MSK16QG-6]MCP1199648.1 DUF87 domain-containing protein [Notoacmeibacter sp. MSK16QG-6]